MQRLLYTGSRKGRSSSFSVAGQEGLEPPTTGLEIRCSIQLSYCPSFTTVAGLDLDRCYESVIPIVKAESSLGFAYFSAGVSTGEGDSDFAGDSIRFVTCM